MKIKAGSGLLPLNILVVLLLIAVAFIPSVTLRIILGLPFILFFPGYVLMLALFPGKEGMDALARVALSFGISMAVTPLIGLALNYTSWGIRLESVLYAVAFCIFAASGTALWRRRGLASAERFNIDLDLGWMRGGGVDRLLSLVLGISAVLVLSVLAYVLLVPVVGESFTEFYILGPDGKATDYPSQFTMEGHRVVLVRYGEGRDVTSDRGTMILGITSRELKDADYTIRVNIDGAPLSVYLGEAQVSEIGPIDLKPGEKWEKEIRFVPLRTGDRQKMEFVLYQSGSVYLENPPHLWIDVKEGK